MPEEYTYQIRSDQISRSVVSNSLRPHESQHARPLCPSPTPGVHWDSRPSSQWCHSAISSSVVPYSSCPQPLPASESFPMSQLFAWGGQSTGVSALASFLPKKSQGWSPSEYMYTRRKNNKEVYSNYYFHFKSFFTKNHIDRANNTFDRTLDPLLIFGWFKNSKGQHDNMTNSIDLLSNETGEDYIKTKTTI